MSVPEPLTAEEIAEHLAVLEGWTRAGNEITRTTVLNPPNPSLLCTPSFPASWGRPTVSGAGTDLARAAVRIDGSASITASAGGV